MNDLKVPLTPDQENEIGLELERLYFQQGKPMPKDQVPPMVMELSQDNFTFTAIINGLRKMRNRSLKTIKMCDIKDSIRELITYVDRHQDCKYCGRSGFVSVSHPDRADTALACICPRGAEFARIQHLSQWNGQKVQILHGKEFRLVHPDPSRLEPAGVGSGAKVDWEE